MNRDRVLGPLLTVALLLTVPRITEGQSSSITVLKGASVPVATEFAFELQGPGVLEHFNLQGGELQVFESLPAGTYTVTETVPEDWELSAITCGIFFAPGPVASGALQFDLGDGEDLLCQFFNGSLTIPPTLPPVTAVPTLSPTALALLFMALAGAGAVLIHRFALD